MKIFSKAIMLVLALTMAATAFAQKGPRGQLLAGAAKVDVTPDVSALPKTSFGILDHCYVRAIVFSNGSTKGALISFDSGMARLSEAMTARIEKELGIPVKNIMTCSTHTHSGAAVRGEEFENLLWNCIKTAHDKMVPAKVGYGNGISHLNVKRDIFDEERGTWWEGPDYDGKSDKTVAVIYFESLDGKPIATYFNYAMHAVITGNLDMVSGDFPGAASRYIESRYGDDFVAAFASGAAGDQNPIYFQQTFDLRDIRIADYAKRGEDISNKMPPGGQGMDRNNPEVQRLMNEQKKMSESFGQLLGEEVKYVIMNMRRFETNVTINGGAKEVMVPGRRQLNGGGRAGYAGEYVDTDPVGISLFLVMIDDIPVCGVGGEIYNYIAVRLKNESPYARTMMTTLANGARGGYIPDNESYGAQTFEVLGARYKQGYAEGAIVNGLLDLIHEATH